MKNLAQPLGVVAVLLEPLRQRHDVGLGGANVFPVVEHLRGVGPMAGEERGAARVAERHLAISAFEYHAARRQLSEVCEWICGGP